MINKLDLKLLRDLSRLRAQAIAVMLVVAGGTALQVTMGGSYASMTKARDVFYEQYDFADVFANAVRVPQSLTDQIARLPGVSGLHARVVGAALVRSPGESEYATAKMVALPLPGQRAAVNRVLLTRGRLPRHGFEALASEAFFEGREMELGERMQAIVGGNRVDIEIVGAALATEFVAALPPGGIIPDDKRHGILWLPHETLAAALGFEGSFNEVGLSLRRDANMADVRDGLDRLLERFGGSGSYTRDEHESNAYLDAEIDGLDNSRTILPPIFILVAAFLINMALGRAVSADRGRIGLLKALGYTNSALSFHYCKMAVALVVPGIALGIALGYYLGGLQVDLYGKYYRLPDLVFSPSLREIAVGSMFTLSVALLATTNAMLRAARLAPAEAMSPPPPPSFRPSVIEQLLPLEGISASARCIARNLLRWPLRAGTTALGIGMAGALMLMGFFFGDAVDLIERLQFDNAERQDVTVAFTEEVNPVIIDEIGRLPGVLTVEPTRTVFAELSLGRKMVRRPIYGILPDAQMRRPVDEDLRLSRVAPRGLVLSRHLAETLDVSPGEVIDVKIMTGKRRHSELEVTGISDILFGSAAYMQIDALFDFLGEGPRLTGALLRIDSAYVDQLRSTLPAFPSVASLAFKQDARRIWEENVNSGTLFAAAISMSLALIIIIGVAYSCVRVSMEFRQRELATLRVLGFYLNDTVRILLGEVMFVTVCALPLCAVLGRFLSWLIAHDASNELFTLPLILEARSYALNMLTVAFAVMIACIPAVRVLKRMNLSEEVKARE